ncbi:DUF2254 domain-containing protein [Haloferula sp.]|uniref:DUF2254 domain-containing protein n=1 Tax=Haloferula sp. TaxID=2497595 RepID=UPI003C754BF6
MKTKIQHLLHQLRASFWAIPSFSVALAILTGSLLVWLDHRASDGIASRFPWFAGISPEGTTAFLGTIASSVLALAGVTFSGTLVALTLASSQFGPRLLRNFIQANITQTTLGILLATYVYCLIVIRNVHGSEVQFVPHLATLFGFLLSLLSLGFFIAFIQHVVGSIQAERVVADVYRELCQSIDRFFGREGGADEREEEERRDEKQEWEDLNHEETLDSVRSGYLQAIDIEGIVTLASERDIHCRILAKPGMFIVPGGSLLAWNVSSPLEDEDRASFQNCFLIGSCRTAEQDFEYSVRQLVEIALRALSPGINDPFTAINCIDYLGGALVKVAGKKLPKDEFSDDEGVARVRIRPDTFSSFLEAACNQIRQGSPDKPEVSIRMLEMLTEVGRQCRLKTQLEAVLHQGDLVGTVARANATTKADEEAIAERHAALMKLGDEP